MEKIHSRKEWIRNLKSQIMGLYSTGKSDREIKKQIRGEFNKYSTTPEKIIQVIFAVLLIGFILLGIHIGYTILLWEANLYAYNDSLWSPYVSMLIFGIVCVLLFMIFSFWFG